MGFPHEEICESMQIGDSADRYMLKKVFGFLLHALENK